MKPNKFDWVHVKDLVDGSFDGQIVDQRDDGKYLVIGHRRLEYVSEFYIEKSNKIPVLAISYDGYDGATMYVNTLDDIQENLETFLGENNAWFQEESGTITIQIQMMNRDEFESLEPMEF